MKKTKVKDFLNGIIPENLLNSVNRSFEIVGDIAITEINPELIKYEQEIGEAIMKTNTSIKTVLKKSGIHSGEFRTQDLIHIAGENKKETIYNENGIKLIINPEKVYFSARLSVERQELMSKLEERKRVLIMFSGIGPYSFVALKKQPNLLRISSIELNPIGHDYAKKNLKLNKNLLKKSNLFKEIIQFLRENNLPINEKKIISNLNEIKINFINGDVKKEIPKFKIESIKYQEEFKEEINFNSESPETIFNSLLNLIKKESKTLHLNLDSIKKDRIKLLLYFIILFQDKFNFICRINDEIFKFNSKLQKTYLSNYLEIELKIPIKSIPKYDEIFMPLPKDAHLFLDEAFKISTNNTIIHLYDFVLENEFPNKTIEIINNYAKKYNSKIEILHSRKVGQYAPGKFRICVDFKINSIN